MINDNLIKKKHKIKREKSLVALYDDQLEKLTNWVNINISADLFIFIYYYLFIFYYSSTTIKNNYH